MVEGSLDDLRANLAFMAHEYRKPIIIVETAYSWRPDNYMKKRGPFPETPEGQRVGRAGRDAVIVPGGPPMFLTATGTEQRRALVLILHQSSKPPTTVVHNWTPKGLCKN